jgi:hypothetical protein
MVSCANKSQIAAQIAARLSAPTCASAGRTRPHDQFSYDSNLRPATDHAVRRDAEEIRRSECVKVHDLKDGATKATECGFPCRHYF